MRWSSWQRQKARPDPIFCVRTPPVGSVQFVGCAIGGVSVGQVMRTIWPFYGALALCLLLVTYVPAFSLWLPGLFKGG